MKIRKYIAYLKIQRTKLVVEVGATNMLLLLILAVITLYPLLFVGFTTHDDVVYAINAWTIGAWEATKALSMEQGRVGLFWGYPLFSAPYIFDNRIWYFTFKFGSFFLLLGGLYYAVFQFFRSSWIALATMVFFLGFIQNGWEHNAFTSYTFAFNFCAALFLISLGIFSTAIDRKNLALAVLSGALYFFTCSFEVFVLFFPFYIAILLSRSTSGGSIVNRIMLGKRYVFSVAIWLIAYLMLYVVWRYIHPSNYDGNGINGQFNVLAVARVVGYYSLTAFPLASLHLFVSPGDPLPFTNSASWYSILTELNAASFTKSVVVGILFARLITIKQYVVLQTRTLLIGSALLCVGIFLPNLLLGFVQRHQDWVSGGTHSYVFTYYSFIFATILSALLLAYIHAKSRSLKRPLRLLLTMIVVVATMTVSFAVEVRNQFFAFDQKLAHRKWQLMNEVIKSTAFMGIPEGSVITAPTLLAFHRGYAAVFANDWTSYVNYKTGKNIIFVGDKCQIDIPCYSLVFRQEVNTDHQFVVLSKINRPDILVSSEITVYSMPPQAGDIIFGSFAPIKISPKLEYNGKPVVNVGAGMFSLKLLQVPDDRHVQSTKIIGNVDINPEKITISHYSVEPSLRSWSDELADGVDFKNDNYPDILDKVSGLSTHEPWGRWTDANVGSVAIFRFKQALPRNFTLEIIAGGFGPNIGEPVKVRVGGVEKTFIIGHNKESDVYRLEFENDGAENTLEITPPKPMSPNEIDQKNEDRRKLGISFVSIKIR
jgi:hypothetical protein